MKDFIKARELVVGYTYSTRQDKKLLFLGKFDEYTHDWKTYTSSKKESKQFYFADLTERNVDRNDEGNGLGNDGRNDDSVYEIITFKVIGKRLKAVIDEECHCEIDAIKAQLNTMPMYSPIDLARTVVEEVPIDYFVKFVKDKVAEDYYFRFLKVFSMNDEYYMLNNPCGVIYFQYEDSSGYRRKEKNHYEGVLRDFDSIEELYEILSPCIKHYYLASGHHYITKGVF